MWTAVQVWTDWMGSEWAAAGAEEGEVVGAGQEVGPGEGAAQALDRGELGLGVALDGQGAGEQVGMVLAQPEDLRLL
jgi:hypothetical protein